MLLNDQVITLVHNRDLKRNGVELYKDWYEGKADFWKGEVGRHVDSDHGVPEVCRRLPCGKGGCGWAGAVYAENIRKALDIRRAV